MKTFLLALVLITLNQHSQAQVFENNEVLINIGGSSFFYGAFNVDAEGNSYGTIQSDYQLTFESGAISGPGEVKIFKHDKFGDTIWQTAAGTGSGIHQMVIDDLGNIYIAGYQQSGLITALNSPDFNNFTDFIAKLNPDGTFAWMIRMPGRCQISTTSGGNVGFAVVMDPTNSSLPMLGDVDMSGYYKNVMYGEINSTGNVDWYEISPNQLPVNSLGSISGTAYNNGKFYFYGYYHGTFDFGGIEYTLYNSCSINGYLYSKDMFLTEIDWASHAVVDVHQTNDLQIKKIDFDLNNNMIFALQHDTEGGTCAQDGSFMGASFIRPSDDGYVVKLDPNYNLLSSHDLGGTFVQGVSPQIFMSDLVVKGNDVFVSFQNRQSTFGELLIEPNATNTAPLSHMYIMRLDDSLNYKYHTPFQTYVGNEERVFQMRENNGHFLVMANGFCPTSAGTFNHSWFINSYISNANVVEGIVFRDFNYNEQYDLGDTPFSGAVVEVTPSPYLVVSDNDGTFTAYLDSGTYAFSVPDVPVNYSNVNPLSQITLNGNNISDVIEVPITPTPNISDIEINFYSESQLVVMEETVHHITVENVGTTVQDVYLVVDQLDLPYSLGEVVGTPGLNWIWAGSYFEANISNMQPGDVMNYTITYNTPISFLSNIGDVGVTTATVTTSNIDATPSNNSESFSQTVFAAYDPNIKTVQEPFYLDYFNLDDIDYIHYTIHFQNEGNYFAKNIRVSDEIENDLNLSSVRVINASHPLYASIQGNTIHFHFDSIMLVPKNQDEFDSRGYVHFKIRRDDALSLGDSIVNKAEIYFDYNPAIVTNDAINIVIDNVSVDELMSSPSVVIYPNPANEFFGISQIPSDVEKIVLFDQQGKKFSEFNIDKNNDGKLMMPVSGVPPGCYYLSIGQHSYKLIIN